MAPDKSLAAEIEAALREDVRSRNGMTDFVEIPAAARVIASRIAALQSRAFEDGARWMRERAIAAIDMHDRERREWVNGSLWHILTGETSKRVAALPLQPERERNA